MKTNFKTFRVRLTGREATRKLKFDVIRERLKPNLSRAVERQILVASRCFASS